MSRSQRRVKDDFADLVPDKGWFRDYHLFTSNIEPPTAFNFFSAASVLGACLGRQVWIPWGHSGLYPNLSCILIGPAGRVRKSTASNAAVDVGIESGRLHRLAGESATQEAIIKELSLRKPATGLIYAPELSTFLNRKDYNRGLIQFLSSLLDCKDRVPLNATVVRGVEILEELAVSLLGASNEAWLVQALPADAFSGGFMSRLLPIYASHTTRRFPIPQSASIELRKEVLRGLMESERCRGAVLWSAEARRAWDHWYDQYRDTVPEDERVQVSMERMPDHHLRIATLLAVAEKRPLDIILEGWHIDHAGAILKWVIERLPRVFAFLGVTTVGEDQRRILEMLVRHGGRLERSSLVRKMAHRVTVRQLDSLLETLLRAQQVEEIREADKGVTRVLYRLATESEEIP